MVRHFCCVSSGLWWLWRRRSGCSRYYVTYSDGNSFAIKCFTKAQIQKHPELSRYIKNEYKVMRAIQHENVLKQEYNIEGESCRLC